MALQRPKGTHDYLPEGSPKLKAAFRASHVQTILQIAQTVLERSGAQFIITPLFEEMELIKRGVGGSSDIVRKEMFTVYYFGDHGGYVLRPEGTAGVVRAYLENGLKQLPSPLKLWTHGPMFRAENVHQGRYRQFHQIDYEIIGSDSALADAEAIALMVQTVEALGLNKAQIKLGSIGDAADRENYSTYLREVFTPHDQELSEESRDRLKRNPLRILDSKSATDQALIAKLSVQPLLDFLGDQAAAHFAEVRGYLDAWGVAYDLDPSIVRGLDYYNRTAWELHHQGVGAKSALGGGGRYDGLAEELGGPATPGLGWALGIERVLLALEAERAVIPSQFPPLRVFVAALDEQQVALAAKTALEVRACCRAEFAYRALKPAQVLREAQRRGAVYAALIGSQEAQAGRITLKHLGSGVQQFVPLGELPQVVQQDQFAALEQA